MEFSSDFKTELAQQLTTVLGPLRIGEESTALAAAKQVASWVATLPDLLTQARVLFQLGEMLDKAGLHTQSQLHFEHSLSLSQTLDSNIAHRGSGLCLQRLGAIHRDAGHFSDAIDYYQRSLVHFQATGHLAHIGAAWNNLGLAQHRSRDLTAAEESYHRALDIGDQTKDVRLHASSLGNLGKVALDRWQLPKAEQLLRAAVELSRSLDDSSFLRSQLGDLANVLRVRGRSGEAIQCYEEVLRLADAQDDIRGRQLTLGNLGAIYRECGELSQALIYLERSYIISREHGSTDDQIVDLVHLAQLHQDLNERQQASNLLHTALALAESTNSEYLSGVLTALGHIALEAKLLDQAEALYRRCLDEDMQIGDIYNAGATWINLGYVAWQRNDIEQAITHWKKALELHQAVNNPSGLSTTHLNLGGALAVHGDFSEAEAHLRAALNIAEVFPLPEDARYAWRNLALLYWRRGDATSARDACEKAIAWAEKSRLAVIDHTQRIAFWAAVQNPYLDLVQLNLEMEDALGMWQAVQQARSRAFAELLGGSHFPIPEPVPDVLKQREEMLLARLKQTQLASMASQTPDATLELLSLTEALDALWVEMRPLVPEYVAQRQGVPLPLEVLRACLGD